MNSLIKAWRAYWSGGNDDTVHQKIEQLDRRMDEIEIDMRIVFDHLSSIDSPKIISPRTSSTDSEGGSNLGAYIKPNVDRTTTTVQWVTGKQKKYNTRKRIYDTMDMEKVVDEKSTNPKERIKKFKQSLQENNVPFEDITDSTTVLNCAADKLKTEYLHQIKNH
jgi:hypothetical protein